MGKEWSSTQKAGKSLEKLRETTKLFIAVLGSIEHQDQLQASCEILLPLAVGTVWQGWTSFRLFKTSPRPLWREAVTRQGLLGQHCGGRAWRGGDGEEHPA